MRFAKDTLVETIEALYHCAAEPSRWPDALQTVADCFDDFGANLIWRRDDGSFGHHCLAGDEGRSH